MEQADGCYQYVDLPELFLAIDQRVFGDNVSVVALVFAGCVLVAFLALARHVWGRHLYAIGGNEEAARLSGVPVDAAKIGAYVASGVFAAIAEARKEMDFALTRFDDIDVVYAHNDPGAHGAYLAAKAAGREEDILFVGIDAPPQEGVKYVSQGVLDATFEYPTGGREAIDTARKILAGESVPKTIMLKSRIFTKDNVAEGGAVID